MGLRIVECCNLTCVFIDLIISNKHAPLAELVDARDSKSRSRKRVPVRFWRGAP